MKDAGERVEKGVVIGCGPAGSVPATFDQPDLPRGKRPHTCVHYTGIWAPGMKRNETCAVRVVYDAVRLDHEPVEYQSEGRTYTSRRSWPCSKVLNHGGARCPHLQWPTDEETRQYEVYSEALTTAALSALRAAP